MGCLLAILILISPRLVLFLYWLFDYSHFKIVFHNSWVWPLLGFIFLPFTTVIYALVYNTALGHPTSWGWLWVFLAFLVDITAYGASARGRMSGGSNTPTTPTTTVE